MQYITSVERIGIAKGRLEGRLEGASKLLRKQLEHRFGVLPAWAIDKLNAAAEPDLDCWVDVILTASSLEAVFDIAATQSVDHNR
ncbi:MAG: hypothetical protein HOP34_15400 [Methylococcaceae bacterium]|nr:hypothetical protein [Methylococcaceae bacterium]